MKGRVYATCDDRYSIEREYIWVTTAELEEHYGLKPNAMGFTVESLVVEGGKRENGILMSPGAANGYSLGVRLRAFTTIKGRLQRHVFLFWSSTTSTARHQSGGFAGGGDKGDIAQRTKTCGNKVQVQLPVLATLDAEVQKFKDEAARREQEEREREREREEAARALEAR